MVSNFGDNTIGIYDSCGNYLGKIKDKSSNDICIDGVRGLAINSNHERMLYWTSRSNNLKTARVGSINTSCGV